MTRIHDLYWDIISWLYLKWCDFEFWRMMREKAEQITGEE